MAPEAVKGKKRKSATDASPNAKKQKKTEDAAAAPKKSAKATKAAVEPVESLASAVKSTRKQAAEYFSDNEAPVEQVTAKTKKSKKKSKAVPLNGDNTATVDMNGDDAEPKKTKKAAKKGEESAEVAPVSEAPKEKAKKGKKVKHADKVEEPVADAKDAAEDEAPAAASVKKPKKGKRSKEPIETSEEVLEAPEEDGDDEELDDQTAALLAGFESERDESDLEVEEDFNEKALPQLGKKKRNELEKARKDAEPGVIYLGRIPHGFFEPQMKKYFSQFGTVTRLRLSRNKKTGASKHYAFIEFANADVADIVAKTMHNYLMFGHILQCRTIPAEQVHADLFKGANQRFKVDPRNKKAGSAMARGAERAVWEKRVETEKHRRASKAKALKEEFGYEFSPPAVKPVDGVSRSTSAIEDGVAQQLVIEDKTRAKGHTEAEAETAGAEDETAPAQSSKGKKNKKRKSDVTAESKEEPDIVANATPPKAKKAKKETKALEDSPVTEKKRKAKSGDQEGAKPKKTKKAKA